MTVRADPEGLQQALLNLLSNAVKFTGGRDERPGQVEVSCTVSVDDEAPPESSGLRSTVLIHVRDTGVGIAAEKWEMIFEPFVQVD